MTITEENDEAALMVTDLGVQTFVSFKKTRETNEIIEGINQVDNWRE